MAQVTLRKITNLKKAGTIASRYPKSIVKASYGIMIMVFISLAGLGIAQLYEQELEEKQQDINVKAVDVDALLKTTLNNVIVVRSQAEYLGNQRQTKMSLSLAPLLPTIYKQLPTKARIHYTSIAGTLGVTYPAISPMTRKENLETFQKAIHQEFMTSGIKNNPSRKAYFTNPYQDILGKRLIVTAISPVYQGNNHLGNIGIDFPLESLNRFVQKLGGRSAMILTSEGKVLSHPNLQPRYFKSAKYFIPDFSVRAKLLKLLKTGNKGQITINGYLITYQKLNNAPWMIVNIAHRKALVKDIIKKQLPIILGVILGMTIVLLISLRIINQVFTQCQKARMVAELANQKLQKALTELERIASTDTLTGAWNRLYFEEIVSAEINRLSRHNQLLSLLILDIDHFKSINDNYGHPIGDCVLAGLAHLLKDNIRTSDVLTRWGGEEFVILTPSTSMAEAYELAERLRLVIAKHNFPEVRNITASFGIAQFETAETLHNCFKRADDALYHAKNSGRNTVVAAPSISGVYQLKQLAR